jgi:anthranilate phosphoribosyltransferase
MPVLQKRQKAANLRYYRTGRRRGKRARRHEAGRLDEMTTQLTRTLHALLHSDAHLDSEQSRLLMGQILADREGAIPDAQIASLLTLLAARGVTAEELTGFAEAMRAAAVPLPFSDVERSQLVDTCGTGGDGCGTFNVSTAAALVAAAAGAKVAKHGNRALSSRCGSADVLDALGVPTASPPEQAAACLRATGFAFLFAPLFHPAMQRVQAVRRALGFRTVFNLLGPLSNPAHAPAQVLGVYRSEMVPVMADAMARLGIRHGLVVHGDGGLDEFSLSGETEFAEVRNGQVRLHRFHPEAAGLRPAPVAALAGGDAAANAAILRAILAGETGPRRDIVVLNAAAALFVSGLAADLPAGVLRAQAAIDSGAAVVTLASLIEFGRKSSSSHDRKL